MGDNRGKIKCQYSNCLQLISSIIYSRPLPTVVGLSTYKYTCNYLFGHIFSGRPRKHPEKPPLFCRPITDFARKHALDRRAKYAPKWGKKRCKLGRVIKPRIDPLVEWPRVEDFQPRFRLPPSVVQQLTDEFERSPFRPGKGKHEKRGSPIPLFHKVIPQYY